MAQLKGGVLVEERKKLAQLISQWNVDHYDLFELSQPNENLEFHGVVRFYFQGAGANVVTKCIRVSSTATTKEVIDVLVEKFRPDMRMLTQDKYALYEVHVNGEENKLRDEDHPLLVQLNWGRDVREGRFLLKRENEATAEDMEREMNFKRSESSFKRKSKREKKKEKKKEKEKKENGEQEPHGVAERLYQDLPETSFTRSISNPEAVMRRRRQQKIEKRMQQMRGQDGGPDQGGMLKIYGETVRPDVPYKTLLVHIADTAGGVVMEAMAKYGLEKEDPTTYCLVMVIVPPSGLEYHGGSLGEERILDESECPLALVMGHPKNKGHVIFQLRRRPSGEAKSRGKPMRGAQSHNDLRYAHEAPAAVPVEEQPFLQEMYTREQKMHRLPINVTEVGSERSVSTSNQYLQLQGPDIMPRHCVVAHTEGIVTVTPTSRDAEVYVEHQRIYETTMLKHNMTVQFGKSKAHIYRFVDPRFENRKGVDKPDNRMQAAYAGRPQETNFDLDGHVETVTPHQRQPDREEMPRRAAGEPAKMGPGQDNRLPSSLEFRDDAEQPLLNAVILNVNSRAVQFKLAPTYTLYMMVRHYVENHFHPQTPPQVRRQRLAEMLSRIARMVQDTIQSQHKDPTALAFWMANASEVLHVIKSDRDVGGVGEESQEVLAEAVQMAFHHLVMCLQNDLQRVMPAFLDPTDSPQEEDMRADMGQNRFNPSHPSLADVLNTLSAAMTLLRRCRVNAALTIQFFSQLFHFINMWLFNIIVTEPQLQLCTRSWGIRLKRRLGQVEAWAEKQGLELAADCHLCRIIQAAHLLQAAKTGPDDITNISSTCFKLNSKQIRALLSRYINEPNEPPISPQFIERVVVIAESMADELARTDGREVRLEEDADLRLPFLLPEDGYSCDTIHGVPGGLPEFIKPFTNSGLCNFIIHSAETGSWIVHMGETQAQQKLPQGDPEVMTVAFGKVKGSMGLSIVAAMGENQSERGIYIKSVVPGGAAAQDGRLQAGDQLLEVDGRNLVGLTQDKAAELMTRTGQTVTLKVAKQGAIYHGLATLLSQPSPTLPRAAQQKGLPVSNHLKPKGEEAPPPYSEGSDSPRYPPEPTRPTPTPRTSVPPTAQPRTSLENQFRDGPDRVRATSSGNLPNDTRGAPPPQRPLGEGYYRPNAYEQDPRSKSTSNLHVDTSFDRGRDPYNMKPAQSVSALPSAGFNSPGGRGANPNSPNYAGGLGKINDYENQPQLNTSMQDAGKDMRGYPDINQNVPPGSKGNPNLFPGAHIQRPNDRSSVSSRTSNSSSQRETRPQSAYYDVQAREREEQGHAGMRPKSDEITPNRLKEWQDKYEDSRGKPGYEQDSNSPPYSNIPPQHMRQEPARESGRGLTAHQRLFGQRPPQQQQQQQQPQHPPQQQQQHPPPQQQHLQPQPQDGGPRSPYAQGNPPHSPYANGSQQRPPYGQENAPRANFAADNQQRPPYGQETPPRMNYGAEMQQRPGYGQERPPYGQESQQPGFNGQDLGRMNAQNQARQPNFYENTMPQPQEPAPQFNQIQRHPDFNKGRPPTAPKPSLAPKPNQPRVQPQDMPVRQVDNRMSQPNFFENKPSPSPQMAPVGQQQQQQQGFRQPKGPDPMGPGGPRNVYGAPPTQMSPHEGGYGYANEVPPDLPPPPEEFHEDSPPLPPPPANYLLEQQLADEQRKMMQQIGNAGGADPQRFGGNPRGFPSTSPYQPMQQVPPPPNSQAQQNSIPNYQNIHFGGGGYSPDSHPPPPPAEHNVYEQYEARQQDLRRNEPVRPPWQQQQPPPQQQQPPPQQQLQTPASVQQGMPLTPQSKQISPPRELLMPGGSNPTHLTVGEGEYTIAASPWEREQREKMMEKQEEELSRLRDQEIAELENRTYLNPQEQERLRKLKLEQEFQRRVREASEADYDDDSDSEATERLFTRERMIQGMKEDLEKIKIKMAEYDQRMMRNEYHMEKERAQRLERRLEMFEKDREEQRERLRKRQERKQREHQEQLQQQREMREKQRQSFEEQKRLLMMEEEKMKQRREEELQKKRQMEREQLAEMQAQREKEEAALRAEARQREEEYQRQRFQQQQQERLFQQRPIRVAEERRRLDAATVPPPPSQGQLSSPGYQQYANLPPQGPPQGKENFPPPPPERTSSHDLVQQHRGREFPSALRSGMERDGAPLPAGPKKSVTFNTQLETQIHQYSVSSISDVEGTPNASVSSYRSSSQSSDQEAESPPYANQPPSNDVFSPAVSGANPDIRYHHSPGTPGVIGSQEVYRDPKLRIEAQKAQLTNPKKPNSDRMSFRDKMKFFAAEAGEDSPKYKAKASRTQRTIESQLNGK